jgi:hypothetical protein
MTTTSTKSRKPAHVAAAPVEDKTARGRVWRQGTLVDEDFDFAKIPDSARRHSSAAEGATPSAVRPLKPPALCKAAAFGGVAQGSNCTRSIPDPIPPEALMRVRFTNPDNMAPAIASQLQPVASELVPVLREAAGAVRGHIRTGKRS